MINIKKRILPLMIAAIVFIFTGCNSGSSSQDSSSRDLTDVKISEKVLTWAIPNVYHISEGALTQFNKTLVSKGYDFAVRFVPISLDEYSRKLDEYENKNGTVDIAFSGLTNAGSPFDVAYQRIKNGYYIELQDYLETSEGKKLYEMFDSKQWDTVRVDDKIYTIPNAYWKADEVHFVFNKKYISEKDLKDFTGNIADLEPFLKKIPTSENFSHILMGLSTLEGVYPYIDCDMTYYGLMLSHDGKGAHNPFDYAPYRDFLTCYHDYYKKGYMNYNVPSYALGIDYDTQVKILSSGNFFVYVTSNDVNYQSIGAETVTYTTESLYVQSRPFGSVGITQKSEHKDDAFKLLSLVHTDNELANILVYGEEGVDFKLEDGVAKTMDGGIPVSEFNQYWLGLYGSVSPTAKEKMIVDRNTDRLKYFKDKVKASPYIGKNFDTTGYEDIITAIYKIYEENYDIWTRDDIEAEMDRVNQELKEAGIDKLVDAMNEQFGIK